jgi:beta-galactosidase/beta-glucuronidase
MGRGAGKLTGTIILGLLSLSLRAEPWKPVPGHIMTRWAAQVNPLAPLPEYPRPQMVRPDWINLNGLWDYAIEPLASDPPDKYSGKILVPYPIESALSGLKLPLTATQRLWYHRSFKAPDLAGGKRLLLHFGAVDWETKVAVNGRSEGEHRGGYDPFTFDITDASRSGADNNLVVAVFDPTGSYQPKGKQNFNKIAKPGGIAYTPCSGIWQTVWLEAVPANYIESFNITPDVDAGVLRLWVKAPTASSAAMIEASAWDGEKLVGGTSGKPGSNLVLPIEHACCWTPDNPFLYTLKLKLANDVVSGYFAMRKIAIGKDEKGVTRPLLNGKFLFQSGPLDQGYWPDGIYTAPTDQALRFDIEEMKRLGFNMVRKHLKVEPERWYYWCDKLGLLVWQDMPNGDGGKAVSKDHDGVVNTPVAAREFETELQAMVETHYNHPCIIQWTIFNEGWGQYDVLRLTKWVKSLDGSRLVNSTSGWHDQSVGDVVDAHSYPGPVCPKQEADRAAVLGEFGGLGLRVAGHCWLTTNTWSYRSTSNSEELTQKYLDLWRKVWQLKSDSGLCAAVYTQLTDVETECNGLLTYDREIEKVNVKLGARPGEQASFLNLQGNSQ